MVERHDKNDWLGKQDFHWPLHRVNELDADGTVILTLKVCFGGRVRVFILCSTNLQYHWSVGLFEKKEAKRSIDKADDGKNPEYPTPVQVLDNESTDKRACGRA